MLSLLFGLTLPFHRLLATPARPKPFLTITVLALSAGLFAQGCSVERIADARTVALTNRILFTNQLPDGRIDIFHVGIDGLNPIRLTHSDTSSLCPVTSPDGTRIVFTRGGSMLVMDPDGSNIKDLTPQLVIAGGGLSSTWITCPTWSPDGTKLAFARRTARVKSPGSSELYTINADGTGLIQLTTGDTFHMAEWSPRGDKISVASNKYTDGGPYDFAVIVINSDGSGLIRLPAGPFSENVWSPTGTHVAFTCTNANVSRICVASANGTEIVSITSGSMRAGEPDWAPDGTRITFRCDSFICMANPDGTALITLTSGSGFARNPEFSPDSKTIAYDCNTTICVVAIDGSGERTLVSMPGVSSYPRWSPGDIQ